MENLRIGIIGNIGSGKAQLIKALTSPEISKRLLSCLADSVANQKINIFPEEIDEAVLKAFYENPGKNAFLAQIEFLNGRLMRQEKIDQAQGIVLEDRTIFEDYYIFGTAQKILGFMSEEEFKTYQRAFKFMTNQISEPDLVIYLRAKTDDLMENIKKHARPSEAHISRDYIELLNNLYETFASQHLKCPIMVIDVTDENSITQNVESIIQRLIDKILELNLRITTPGIREWISLPETAAAIRVVDAERKLEDYLKKHPTLITVAGNVGMGKSTVTTLMHQSLRIQALFEAPEQNPLLERFLKDKKRYCYDLQKHFLSMRADLRKRGKDGQHSYVKDRSLAEDILVFCKLFHQDGLLTENELDLLMTEFQQVSRALPSADLLIVLQGSSKLAWQRIQERARAMEMDGGWTYREISAFNDFYKTFPEDVVRCGFHKNPLIKINTNKLDFTNRVHMGYLFEQVYEALN
ncbi:MAG: deoxynucleoside kinase [Gammaproteobacteria bacterium]|nr:deoxynucleoside kinase [Gammaproteobacteria bacterium]